MNEIPPSLLPAITSRDRTSSQTASTNDLKTFLGTVSKFTPLTLLSHSHQGQSFQLLKTNHCRLLGALFDAQGQLTLISGNRIKNALNPHEKPEDLISRLQDFPVKEWGFAFDAHKLILTIWPHLSAAGPYGFYTGQQPQAILQDVQRRYSKVTHVELIGDDGQKTRIENHRKINETSSYVKTEGGGLNRFNYTAAQREKTGKYVKKEGEFILNSKGNPYDHGNKVKQSQREARNIIKDIKNYLKNPALSNQERAELQNEISKIDKTIKEAETYTSKKPPVSRDHLARPGTKGFESTVRQTRLTDSYNANHPESPIVDKGTKGTIGGVACGLEYIEGLFDSTESLFEDHHYFMIPTVASQEFPFSDGELKQILRELAVGVFAHDTIPFFSLHFRQGTADLFPVIHPAYEHTLVGRVIALLDYFMKGYLNGGVYSEDFIQKWHEDPNWERKKSSALAELIDFADYCDKHLQGEDKEYRSSKSLQDSIFNSGLLNLIESALSEMSPVLADFTGFSNSFRIIAKQNSFQKHGSVFVIDPDFDVFYTIAPSPIYKEALTQHVRKNNSKPPAYTQLDQIYQLMSQQIHNHMVKMPFCKKYFAMLGVIHFFSCYFSTLKKHRKYPVLDPAQMVEEKCSPQLFPHLPVISTEREALQCNPSKTVSHCLRRTQVRQYFSSLANHLETKTDLALAIKHFRPAEQGELKNLLQKEIEANILSNCSAPFGRYLKKEWPKIEPALHLPELAADLLAKLHSDLETMVMLARQQTTATTKCTLDIDKFLKIVPSVFSNENTSMSLELPYSTARLASELSKQNLEKNQRVVGGCGLRMQPLKIESSPQAKLILDGMWKELATMPMETFKPIQTTEGQTPGVVFGLKFAEIPAGINDNYAWMALGPLLNGAGEEELKHQWKAFLALSEGNKDAFKEVLNSIANPAQLPRMDGLGLTHLAAKMKDPAYLHLLLNKGLKGNEKDHQGFQPIHYAAMEGALAVIDLLLKKDPSYLNAKSHNCSTPLVVAIQHNQKEAVKFLLQQNPTAALLAGGYTDLHCALQEGEAEIIEALMSAPFVRDQVKVCCQEGGTPLMLACELDNELFVGKLIRRGADVAASRKDGMTAIEIAIRNRKLEVLRQLLQHAKPSSEALEAAGQVGSIEVIKLLEVRPNVLSFKNNCDDNLLHIALKAANIRVARYLMKHVSLYEGENLEHDTPLDLALSLNAWDIVEEIYRQRPHLIDLHKLLKANYHPFVKKAFQQVKSIDLLESYLVTALKSGNHLAISQILIPKGVKLSAFKDEQGKQAIHYLAQCNAMFLFQKEIQQSSDFLMPLPGEGNKTLAYLAAESQSFRIFHFLLKKYKEKNVPLENHGQGNHLFYAVMQSREERLITEVLELFPELANVQLNESGIKPAHMAAQMGSVEMLQLLLSKGAALDEKDGAGHTPFYYSQRSGNSKCVDFLKKYHIADDATEMHIDDPEPVPPTPLEMQLALAFLSGQYHLLKTCYDQLDPGAQISLSLNTGPYYGTRQQLFLSRCKDKTMLEEIETELKKHPPQDLAMRDSHGESLAHSFVRANLPFTCIPNLPLNLKNNRGLTPLEIAIGLNNKEMVLLLLRSGAKITDKVVPLAIASGDPQLAQYFIILGATDSYSHQKGISLKHRAAAQDNVETLELIAELEQSESGAWLEERIELEPGAQDEELGMMEGATPLHVAVLKGSKKTAQWLLNNGANPEAKNVKGHDALFWAAHSPNPRTMFELFSTYKIMEKSDSVCLALVQCIAKDSLEGVKFLYNRLHVNTQLINKSTGLHVASLTGALHCSSWLLQEGADPLLRDDEERNAFEVSVRNNSAKQLEALLDFTGRDVDETDEKGETLLHVAAREGLLSNVAMLIAKGADMSLVNVRGMTPLHLSVAEKQVQVLQLLLDCGANPDVRNTSGKRPIDLVEDDVEIKEVFNRYHVLCKESAEGDSPLHFAVRSRNILAVKIVASFTGCDLKNNQGETPLDLAQGLDEPEICLFLSRLKQQKD